MTWEIPTDLEIAKERFRQRRKNLYRAFDIWEKAVLRGREEDSQEVINWYYSMLDFTDKITEATTPEDYPKTPKVLEKYL